MDRTPRLPWRQEVPDNLRTDIVWLIDDDVLGAETYIEFWMDCWVSRETDSSQIHSDARPVPHSIHFTSAVEALERFGALGPMDADYPDVILVDGRLANDDYPYREGSSVVATLRELACGQRIRLIAFSSDPDANDAMLRTGADAAVNKLHPRDIIGYVR